jgi:hypothetical protein
MKELLLRLLMHPHPLRATISKKIIERFSRPSYVDKLKAGAIERPQYGYCIFEATRLARLLNYKKISVIEFGCAGGRGLLAAEMHINEIMKLFNVSIELYGFDTGTGLPAPRDYRDLPYYFQPGSFKMNHNTLREKLKTAELVFGDVEETCRTFFEKHDAAPVGCVFHDLDFYSSTRDALTLFDAGAEHFLPRTFIYFDDITGDEMSLYNEFTGERLAITEFNQQHKTQKIAQNHYLTYKYPGSAWPKDIFIYHDFLHPKYNDFVANDMRKTIEDWVRLT